MARVVTFTTQGVLDLRALTMFGLSAKPNTKNPIGFFGTGLKMAFAVLARHSCKVDLWTAGRHYTLHSGNDEFRGKEFQQLYLQWHITDDTDGIQGSQYIELPFTLELGKTWELWQAMRELYSNHLDESGGIISVVDDSSGTSIVDFEDYTHIQIESDEFDQDETIQVFDTPSKYIYYRGIRVYELPEVARHTYNILTQIQLTEDRTIKWLHEVVRVVAEFTAQNKSPIFVQTMITAETKFEREMDFNAGWKAPSKEFLDTAQELGGHPTLNASATRVVNIYRPKPRKPNAAATWALKVVKAIEHGDWDEVSEAFQDRRGWAINAMNRYAEQTTDEEEEEIPF
jgi:hypothetical protein